MISCMVSSDFELVPTFSDGHPYIIGQNTVENTNNTALEIKDYFPCFIKFFSESVSSFIYSFLFKNLLETPSELHSSSCRHLHKYPYLWDLYKIGGCSFQGRKITQLLPSFLS